MVSILRHVVQLVNKPDNVRSLCTKFNKKVESPNKIWSQLITKNKKYGGLVKLRVQTVPKQRFEDFIDLKMNHFVKDVITYKVSGINDNPEAITECRQTLSAMMRQPSAHTHVYFLDDETKRNPEIIGASLFIYLYPQGETKVKTKEMKKFLAILNTWNQLYTHDEVFKRYGVDRFYEDGGLVIHPKYRLLGIAKYDTLVRRLVCITHGVPIASAWCTMIGTQRACEMDDWDTLFEMSYEELGSRLGIRFNDPPPS